jgi:hypothetical protein
MKAQLKLFLVTLGVLVALLATVFSVFADPSGLSPTFDLMRMERLLNPPMAAGNLAAQACSKMTASDVAWVTLTEDGDIDEQVDAYDSGVTEITPLFEYNCIPKKTTLVTVFTYNGEQVYSDKESLKASNTEGLYAYPLITTDDSAFDEGEWGVEFYNNKTLLTSGTILVGGSGEDTSTVTVVGTVKDAKSKKAIKGAIILVLVPGVTIQDFIDGGQKDEDVFTAAQSDSKGQFELESPLDRNTEYSIIAVAKGYKPVGQDGFVIADEDPNPLQLDITMKK